MYEEMYDKLRAIAVKHHIVFANNVPKHNDVKEEFFFNRASVTNIEKVLVINRTKQRASLNSEI